MAKVENDKFTADILGAARPVGRPLSPHGPRTDAERKRAQRERRKASGREQITVEVSAEIIQALKLRALATATQPERTQQELVESILFNQLIRKR
jgi:hypothetical protein